MNPDRLRTAAGIVVGVLIAAVLAWLSFQFLGGDDPTLVPPPTSAAP
ncbi:MAG TPA: hypothetical protein VNK73_04835 [Actinomycetota bacterium]|jgi:uncharacterized membrane protein YgaE (UPF0421/DUF939 family)|nr:hypothetical protein [Actinomycetota bacterium]